MSIKYISSALHIGTQTPKYCCFLHLNISLRSLFTAISKAKAVWAAAVFHNILTVPTNKFQHKTTKHSTAVMEDTVQIQWHCFINFHQGFGPKNPMSYVKVWTQYVVWTSLQQWYMHFPSNMPWKTWSINELSSCYIIYLHHTHSCKINCIDSEKYLEWSDYESITLLKMTVTKRQFARQLLICIPYANKIEAYSLSFVFFILFHFIFHHWFILYYFISS